MKIKIKKFSVILLLIAIAIVAIVSALPPSSSDFRGTLTINGNPAPIGTVISAWINNVPYPTDSTVYTADGSYKILSVNGDDLDTEEIIEGGRNGDTVAFKVSLDGKRYIADQTGIWNSGTNQKIDLTVNPKSGAITMKKGWNLISLSLDPIQ